MPGPLTLGPVRWSPPRREAHRGSSRTVFREGDIRCGPGDPSRTGHSILTPLRVSLFPGVPGAFRRGVLPAIGVATMVSGRVSAGRTVAVAVVGLGGAVS